MLADMPGRPSMFLAHHKLHAVPVCALDMCIRPCQCRLTLLTLMHLAYLYIKCPHNGAMVMSAMICQINGMRRV